MKLYYSKEGLYREIHQIKEFIGIPHDAYDFNIIKYCMNTGVLIESIPFSTHGLRGMAVIGSGDQEDIILLNSSYSKCEQNFYCGHEIIHLCLHRDIGKRSFNCFENVGAAQNPYLEWHANEGAAELFVPYKTLLPLIKQKIGLSRDYRVIESAKKELADIFNVPEIVIKYRLENLKYEIYQFLNGASLENIKILSLKQQKERGIFVDSLNTISDIDLCEKIKRWKIV